MTSAVVDRSLRLWQAPIGKKAVMSLSGIILFGFAFVHMAGNLQFFLGQQAFDHYGELAKGNALILWGVRSLLIVSAIAHVTAALQLSALKRAARPVGYTKPATRGSSLANRTMMMGGLVLLCFLVFHILHFTTGTVHPSFSEGRVFDNVVSGFQVVPVAAGYIVAMLALSLHLYHGVFSVTQTLGFNHPKYTPRIQLFSKVFAVTVTAGFIALPLSVLLGYGR